MFNIFKVAVALQTVPYLQTLHDKATIQPSQVLQNEKCQAYCHEELLFANSPEEKSRKQVRQRKESDQRKKNENERKRNNKKDDDDHNGGGGLLEPLIEDLQGFIKGKRSPVLNI